MLQAKSKKCQGIKQIKQELTRVDVGQLNAQHSAISEPLLGKEFERQEQSSACDTDYAYIKIMDFGRDKEFLSVDDLQSALSSLYKGRHVSIIYSTKPHGLLATVFVSVDGAGEVYETYGDQSPVDFSAIKDELFCKTR